MWLFVYYWLQAEQERLRETLKAQEEAIREALAKDKKNSDSKRDSERFDN